MKTRAIVTLLLLLVASAFTVARKQRVTPEELYAEARLAFDRGYINDALSLARKGQERFGKNLKWQELFGIIAIEALSRQRDPRAEAELDRTPSSGNPEATIRRLMARGYVLRNAEVLEEADRLATRQMPSLRAEIAVRRAVACFWKDDYDCVERFANQALALVDRSREPYVFANAHGNVALAAMRRRHYQEAIERYDRSMRFAHVALAKGTLSRMLLNYGWSFMQLGDADEAKAAFRKGVEIAREQGDRLAELTLLGNISSAAIAQQRFDEALSFAQRSLDVARKYEKAVHTALALTNLAQAQIELGHAEAARKANDEALALYETAGGDKSYALLNAARIDALTGARDAAMVTLAGLEKSKDLPLRWNVQATMANIYAAEGRVPDAERMYEAALDTGDDASVMTQSSESYLFAFESNLIRTNDQYIEFLLRAGRPLDALHVAERTRARTLLRDSEKPPFAPVQAARIHHATILSYWLAPKRSLLWVITADGVSVVTLPPGAAIDGLIDAYRDEILSRTASLDSARGARLFQLLVAPALQRARSSRFIIIPDGHLNVISLESLVSGDPRPHYWIEDATVSYAPALALIPPAAEHRPFREAHALLMGNVPAQGAQFPALPYARLEIERIARHFGERCRIVTGDDATPAAYLTADLRRVSHVHFVAHGTASMRSPLESSVILSRGTLSGREITRTPLSAELVTVSSCNSAGRRSYAGEGPVGLAWAFLRAGARRVVASQWDVSDTATASVMDGMYRALATDRAPAEALREAKIELLRSQNKQARPFYWAPFILYGAP
ncbi:MAG: CHAT domain-containing protein [Acidobacteriota bacterium]